MWSYLRRMWCYLCQMWHVTSMSLVILTTKNVTLSVFWGRSGGIMEIFSFPAVHRKPNALFFCTKRVKRTAKWENMYSWDNFVWTLSYAWIRKIHPALRKLFLASGRSSSNYRSSTELITYG
jgi:hypothetical protein